MTLHIKTTLVLAIIKHTEQGKYSETLPYKSARQKCTSEYDLI